MDRIYKLPILFFLSLLLNLNVSSQDWKRINYNSYFICYTSDDSIHLEEYTRLIKTGIQKTEDFFGNPFKHEFGIYIHPDRASLDKQWQTDWKMPDFKSECWMVASGVSARLDILSPAKWDKQACEHSFNDKTSLQNLITHELVHIYHGQKNISPDFMETYGIDWFIEGLATFVSGQCDSTRINDVKNAIKENKIPASLDDFWSGNLRYGLSGTLVMFIANKYGNETLNNLLYFNKLQNILETLDTTETELIANWKEFCSSL